MKIRTIILVLAVMTILSSSAGGYLYYSSIKKMAFNDARRHSIVHVEQIKNQLNGLLDGYLKTVQALASLKSLRLALQNKEDESVIKEANSILDHFKTAQDASVCYLMDRTGLTIASSNRNDSDSFVGMNYFFRPYFQQAIQGESSLYPAVGVTSNKRGIYCGHPVIGDSGEPAGVVVIKIDVDRIEKDLFKIENHAHEAMSLILSPQGIIFISDHGDLLGRSVQPMTDDQLKELSGTKQFGKGPWPWMGMRILENGQAVDESGIRYAVYPEKIELLEDWRLLHLSNLSSLSQSILTPFTRLIGYAIIAFCLIIGITSLMLSRMAISDISRRRGMEKALRESEEKLRGIVEHSNNLFYSHTTDHVLTYLSPQTLEFLDCSPEEAMTRWTEFITDNPINEEGFQHTLRAMETGKRQPPYLLELVGKSGRKRWVDVNESPVVVDGRTVAMVGALTDITLKKDAEDALKESERKYRTLIETTDTGFCILNEKGEVLDANAEYVRMTGHHCLDDILGHCVAEWTAEHHKETNIREVQKCFSQGFVRNLEIDYVDSRGNFTPVEINASVVETQEGIEILSICRDIRSRRQAEEERRRQEDRMLQVQKFEAIGALAGGIAHDFNNLLMGIQGSLSLALMDIPIGHALHERLKVIENYVQKATGLTRQLLSFAKGGDCEIKPSELNAIIASSIELFGRTHKEITIHKKVKKDLWIVEADQGQMDQVLLNIYINAWQAMPGGGDIYVQTENIWVDDLFASAHKARPGKYVKISISDTGEGMDAETLKRVFDPFFSTKKKGVGTGLGMTSVYGIIKNHGGIITVYSEKGQGATFNIYLPASEKQIEKKALFREEILRGSETILLMDDEEMIIETTGEMLKALGYSVMTATRGHQAVEIYREKHPEIDLVILDMIMPEMGGREVFNMLRQIKPDVKVLLSSGYSLEGEASDILKEPRTGFIQKPFDMLNLSRIVRKVMDAERA
jgi:PAS domain S-box-containing protein